jgi:hypothetical protein
MRSELGSQLIGMRINPKADVGTFTIIDHIVIHHRIRVTVVDENWVGGGEHIVRMQVFNGEVSHHLRTSEVAHCFDDGDVTVAGAELLSDLKIGGVDPLPFGLTVERVVLGGI